MIKVKNDNKKIETNAISENLKGIQNHKNAALNYEAAAKSHLAAAKHHESGQHDKAAKSTIEAHGYSCLANDAQNEDVKHHASKL